MLNGYLKLLQGQVRENSDHLLIRKRDLFHKEVPDLSVVKRVGGESYFQLLQIFNSFDPVKTEKLKENPAKYEFVTKTTLFSLPLKKTQQEVSDLIALEFSLWFNHAYLHFDRKKELGLMVYEFSKSYLKTDPFESFRKANKE